MIPQVTSICISVVHVTGRPQYIIKILCSSTYQCHTNRNFKIAQINPVVQKALYMLKYLKISRIYSVSIFISELTKENCSSHLHMYRIEISERIITC
jgi:hypothetical protein